jgi:translation initiation factor IF-3
MAHQELGMGLMFKVKEDLNTMAHVEMEPKLMGKSINMTLSPLPANKRKRKFEPHTEEELKALENHTEEADEAH